MSVRRRDRGANNCGTVKIKICSYSGNINCSADFLNLNETFLLQSCPPSEGFDLTCDVVHRSTDLIFTCILGVPGNYTAWLQSGSTEQDCPFSLSPYMWPGIICIIVPVTSCLALNSLQGCRLVGKKLCTSKKKSIEPSGKKTHVNLQKWFTIHRNLTANCSTSVFYCLGKR